MNSPTGRAEEEIWQLIRLATRMASRWCLTRVDAEDVAQEAVIRLVRSNPLPRNATTWLFVVVRRLAHRHEQRQSARRRAEELYERARAPRAETLELSLDIENVLSRLSERDRLIIGLIREGASSRDIADRFGCHVRDVGQMVARVRRRMRQLYGREHRHSKKGMS